MVDLRLQVVATVLGVALAAAAAGSSSGKQFEFQEATVDAIHQGFRNGSLTSTALARFYLEQIARLNPLLRAVIEVNPDALAQAARADAERAASRGRCAVGLHGIPVLLKDNIDTRDRLNTTAGSLALLGSVVRRDAGVVARLRRAGAVILGKANPSEWSNFRPVASGWSARGGQTLVRLQMLFFSAPSSSYGYGDRRRHGCNKSDAAMREITESICSLGNPMRVKRWAWRCGGSQHGGGDTWIGDRRLHPLPVVAQLGGRDQTHCWVDEPIRCHPHHASSRHYWVRNRKYPPVSSKMSDSKHRSSLVPVVRCRPMCRTVSDAVRVLDVIVGYDELDAEATGAAYKYIPHGGYTQFLRTNGLRGKRIGVPDVFFQGYDDIQLAVYEKHLDTMR
jgi:hypothetical protein